METRESILQSINIKKEFSPVQKKKGEKPVKLIKNGNQFWVMLEFGVYEKDKKGNLLLIDQETAKEWRANYLMNCQEEIKKLEEERLEREIQKEVENIKDKLREIVPDYLRKIETNLRYAGVLNDSDTIHTLIIEIDKAKGVYEKKLKEAKEIVMQEDYIYSYEKIKEMYENKNYDALYMYFFQDGLPMIASINLQDNNVLECFKAENLSKTIDELQDKEHIYNVAKFNVLKKKKK